MYPELSSHEGNSGNDDAHEFPVPFDGHATHGSVPIQVGRDKRGLIFRRFSALLFLHNLERHHGYLLTCPPGFCRTSVVKTLSQMVDCYRGPEFDLLCGWQFPNLPRTETLVLSIRLSQSLPMKNIEAQDPEAIIPNIFRYVVQAGWKFLYRYKDRLGGMDQIHSTAKKYISQEPSSVITDILKLVKKHEQKVVVFIDDYDTLPILCWIQHLLRPPWQPRPYKRIAEKISGILSCLYTSLGIEMSPKGSVERIFVFGCSEGNRAILAGIPCLRSITQEKEISELFGFTWAEVRKLVQRVSESPDNQISLQQTIIRDCPNRCITLRSGSLSNSLFAPYGVYECLSKHISRHPSGITTLEITTLQPLLLKAATQLVNQSLERMIIKQALSTRIAISSRIPVHVLDVIESKRPTKFRIYSLLADFGLLVPRTQGYVPLSSMVRKELHSAIRPMNSEDLRCIMEVYVNRLTTRAASFKYEETFRNCLGLLLEQFSKVVVLELPLTSNGGLYYADILAVESDAYYFIELKNIPLKSIEYGDNKPKVATPEHVRHFPNAHRTLEDLHYRTLFDPKTGAKLPKAMDFTVKNLCEVAREQVIQYMQQFTNPDFRHRAHENSVYIFNSNHRSNSGQLEIDLLKNDPITVRGMIAVSLGGAAFVTQDVMDEKKEIMELSTNIHFRLDEIE